MKKPAGKVKCRVCANEEEGFCKVKKTRPKLNKARHCEAFIMEMQKVKIKRKPKTVMRPDWYWNRKEFIKQIKAEEIVKQKALEDKEKSKVPANFDNRDLEKPDILSKFRSSATKEE